MRQKVFSLSLALVCFVSSMAAAREMPIVSGPGGTLPAGLSTALAEAYIRGALAGNCDGKPPGGGSGCKSLTVICNKAAQLGEADHLNGVVDRRTLGVRILSYDHGSWSAGNQYIYASKERIGWTFSLGQIEAFRQCNRH